jgi:predicted acylesterase/phospholipase RssA
VTRARAATGLAGALLLAGCAAAPLPPPLATYDPGRGYRFPPPQPTPDPRDELFVCLALSGGGTRAAALAYGVLDKLRTTRIDRMGLGSLLDEVDCISAVSGGAFAAAYYALFGPRFFEEFPRRFLLRDLHRELAWRALQPWNLVRLASPHFSRVDLAAELYDETVFEGRTFAHLDPRRRPFVILNATSMATGARFEFTQEEFDFLGADLDRVPVARAVAASAAFPVLLSPVTVRSWPAPPGFTVPEEYRNALEDRERNSPRYWWARNRLEAREPEHRYVHLLDGGLADNLGLRAILHETVRSRGFIGPRLRAGHIRRLVVVAVNARTDPPEPLSRHRRPPGVLQVLHKTATVAMEHVSLDTVEFFRALERERHQAEQTLAACNERLATCPGAERLTALAGAVRTCVIEVSFEALDPPERRRAFLSLPTSFRLPPDTVWALVRVGHELLDRSSAFQRLVRVLRSEPRLGAGTGEGGACA